MHHPFTSILDDWLPQSDMPATSTLESLPNELLYIIFPLACTDGGRTGCNLALVSKSIRATSRASRFHSVSLLSSVPDRLEHFLRTLNAAKAEARAEGAPVPCVRHLCISLTPSLRTLGVKITDFDLALMEHRVKQIAELPEEVYAAQNQKESEDYRTAFLPLFAAVYTNLETLCLLRSDCSASSDMPIPCPGGFPRLREFTFNMSLPPFAPPDDGTLMYPALTRLHMTLLCVDTEADFPWWAANALQLAWLRINTVHVFPSRSVTIVHQLARVLGTSSSLMSTLPFHSHRTYSLGTAADGHSWRRSNAPAPFFSKLKTLMLMISPIYFPVDADPSPQVAAAYAVSASALDADLRSFGVTHTVFQPHYDGQDTVKPPGIRQSGSLEEGMRRDWLLRADGAQGLFTSEFWTRTPGVLGRLWKAIRGG